MVPQPIMFVRTNHDDATKFGYYYLGEVKNYASSLKYDVIDLAGSNATYDNFTKTISEMNPIFVYSMGHGSDTVTTGWYNDDLLWVPPGSPDHYHADSNVSLMKDRFVYLLSCYCGKALAPQIVKAGGKVVFAYTDSFGWVAKKPTEPSTDPYAKPFFDAANQVAITLLNGGSPTDAFKNAIDTFNKMIDQWSKSDDPYAPLIVEWLISDRDALTMFAPTGVVSYMPQPTIMPIVVALGGAMIGFAFARAR